MYLMAEMAATVVNMSTNGERFSHKEHMRLSRDVHVLLLYTYEGNVLIFREVHVQDFGLLMSILHVPIHGLPVGYRSRGRLTILIAHK